MLEPTIFGLTTGEMGLMLWSLFCYLAGAFMVKLGLL